MNTTSTIIVVASNQSMNATHTTIVAGTISYYLVAMASLVGFVVFPRYPTAFAERFAQRDYSDLQKDEGLLTSDVMHLRRELRAGASGIELAKERSFVRQDLLNIVLDRMEPAEELQELKRDHDLASLIRRSSAASGSTSKILRRAGESRTAVYVS